MKFIGTLILLAVVGVAGATAFIALGVYNVAADDPHWPVTYQVLEVARTRSIATRAADLQPPDLSDPALIRSGAGNYSAMCVTCHLSPIDEETELSIGLYPRPPRWDALGKVSPREAFWVVKHGVKASGMPAWGKSMDDQYLWGMVAFMQQFPTMTPQQYRDQVNASDGHSHGGGETDVGGGDPHQGHADGMSSDRSSFEPVDDPMRSNDHPEHAEHDHDH